MASSKYKGFLGKKRTSELDMVVSSLRKENVYLKKTLVEMSRQHSEHNRLIERFLSLETIRLESSAKDEKITLPSELSSKKEGTLTDVDSASDERASTDDVTELQNHLSDALDKNKQWLEYDQQREAYVRAILARMLWLEKQLNEANQAVSKQHNEDHSNEKEQITHIQEHYERLLEKAEDELEVLRKQVNTTQQNQITTQNWCEERESEVEELEQQLQTEKISRSRAPKDPYCSEDEEQRLRDEPKDLRYRLDKEKRRSANFELQANICQKFMLNCHQADQEKITVLERQRDQTDHRSCEEAHPPSLFSSETLTSSAHSSLLNESFLECPSCRAEYPASHYRELMDHLEICMD